MISATSSHDNPVAAVLLLIFVFLPIFVLCIGAMTGYFEKPRPVKSQRDINIPPRDVREERAGYVTAKIERDYTKL